MRATKYNTPLGHHTDQGHGQYDGKGEYYDLS